MNRAVYYSVICTRCQMAKRVAIVASKPLDMGPLFRQQLAQELGCPRAAAGRLCGTIEINEESEHENIE